MAANTNYMPAVGKSVVTQDSAHSDLDFLRVEMWQAISGYDTQG